MLKAEYQQERRVRENEANYEQLKSELEKIQRRQREFDRQKEKGTRTTDRAAAGSRPESRMEPHKVLSVVSSDVNILVVHGDERSHEEIPKGISKVPGRNRTGSL